MSLEVVSHGNREQLSPSLVILSCITYDSTHEKRTKLIQALRVKDSKRKPVISCSSHTSMLRRQIAVGRACSCARGQVPRSDGPSVRDQEIGIAGGVACTVSGLPLQTGGQDGDGGGCRTERRKEWNDDNAKWVSALWSPVADHWSRGSNSSSRSFGDILTSRAY